MDDNAGLALDILSHTQIEYLFEEFYNDNSTDNSVPRQTSVNEAAFRPYSWGEFSLYIRQIYHDELIGQLNFDEGRLVSQINHDEYLPELE